MSNKETQMVAKSKEDLAFLAGLQNEFKGAIEVRSELIKTSKLRLCNALSNSATSGFARPGEFTCQEMGLNFGTSVSIIPILVKESASYLDKKTSQILCSSDNLIVNRNGGKCSECKAGPKGTGVYWNDWGTKENKKIPECKASIDMVVIIYDESSKEVGVHPMIINFRKNNHNAGKKLVDLIAKTQIPFARKYTLYSQDDRKDAYEFKIINAKKIEFSELSPEQIKHVIPIARHIFDVKKSGALDMSGDDEDDVPRKQDKAKIQKDDLPI